MRNEAGLYVSDFKGNIPEFIYYFLKWFNLSRFASGAVVPTLNRNHLADIEVDIPNLETQLRITNILGSIDKKIEINKKKIEKLEAIARDIYDYWFVQYEFPDENSKPYKSNGGHFVWNEDLKREIPVGWIIASIANNELSKIIQPGIQKFKSKNYLATANVINSEICDGDWVTYENRETRANMQPIINSVWFAKMKASCKHITITQKDKWFTDKYVLSTGFLGLECTIDSLAFMRQLIYSKQFEIKKDTISHGNTQQAVNNDDLYGIKFTQPTLSVLHRFSQLLNPMLEMITECIKSNQDLISMKNYLLPLLINGQVKVL